jgi:CBS domain-containing protein
MQTVADYMVSSVISVGLDTPLTEIAQIFERQRISAVPVLDPRGSIVGVISRTDLLRVGLRVARSRREGEALTVPTRAAGEVMSQGVIVVEPGTPLTRAAATMVERELHRLFVVDGGRLVGVLSTLDLTAAVRDAEIPEPISSVMASPVQVIASHAPLRIALTRLQQEHVSGLVVIQDDWPVGMFTQVEALASDHLPRESPVEAVLDTALFCLPINTRLHRAAAQAFSLEARRIIACTNREVVGIVTGTDFARVIARR